MLGRTSYKTDTIAKTKHRLKVGITSIAQGYATYKFSMPRNSTIKDVMFYNHQASTTNFLLRYFSGVAGDQPKEQKDAPSHAMLPVNINVEDGGIKWFIIQNTTMSTLEIFYEV